MFGLSISVSGNVGFESQRTVMATVIGAVSSLSSYTTVTSFTFRLTIRTQKWGITEYTVVLALHVA